MVDLRGDGVVGQFQHDDARIIVRRIIADVGKIKITRDEDQLPGLGVRSYRGIVRTVRKNIADILDFVSQPAQQTGRRAGHVGVEQKFHQATAPRE